MIKNKFGEFVFDEADLVDLIMTHGKLPDSIITKNVKIDYTKVDCSVNLLQETSNKLSVTEFDLKNQNNWYMPDEYKTMDIAKYLLDMCRTDEQLQRVGRELLLYQEKNLFNLLKYLKYLVDTMKENQIIWGVGRGSSVASYILYLLGVHKIDSLYYDLEAEEFLR